MSRRGRGDRPPKKSTSTLAEDERLAFAAAMRGVRPLADEQRDVAAAQSYRPPARPRAPAPDVTHDLPPVEAEFGEPRSTSAGRLLRKRVERSELEIGARLDLHGKTVAEARGQLAHFIEGSYERGERCLLVVHGKGFNSPNRLAVLRPNVERWLTEHPLVAVFAPAGTRHGGSGASYVLLARRRGSPARSDR